MEKKKICLIGQFPPPIHGLSKALDTLYEGLKEDFDLERIDLKDNKKILSNLWKIKKSKADVFYFTISQSKGGNLRDLFLLKSVLAKKKKTLIHLHGGYYREMVDTVLGNWQKKKNYKVLQKVDGAIVLSPSLKPIFADMVVPEKIFVVPNCADNAFLLSEEELSEKISVLSRTEQFRVLYLSNFNPEKGYKEVLQLAQCEKMRVDAGEKKRFHFDFAGAFFDETEKDFFLNYVEKNNLGAFVTYHGVVDGEEKKKLLKECHFFTLLTRYPKEGQPISIIEAMGNGLAIVTTDHAAIPDTVTDGVNGIVCKAGEEKNDIALYTKMLQMVTNLPAIAQENYAAVKQDYSEAEYLRKLKELFDKI